MRPRKLAIALSVVAAMVASLTSTPSTQAAPVVERLNVVLLGDSYSAGNGAGSYEPGAEGGSYRSTINWARNYVSWLNDQGVHAPLTNLANSGATTQDVIDYQLGLVPEDTDLVMLTIGGNDVNFSDIVTQCFVVVLRNLTGCQASIESAQAGLPSVKSQTEKIFEGLSNKLGDDAQVVLVGYPLLSTDRKYELTQCFDSPALPFYCRNFGTYDAGAKVRELGNKATEAQQAFVNQWNATHSLRVTYIDSIASAFAGHEPDPSALTRNDYRWINEFIETEGRLGSNGRTQSRLSTDVNNWYHPNVIGHQKIAEQIEVKFGIPTSTKPVGASIEATNVAFSLGNASATDPETVTSYPAQDVTPTAFEVDPVGIDQDVPLITETIASAPDKPFAWVQGPVGGYVGETITLDARGSYAVSGSIVEYEWDFDGDGAFEETSAEGLIDHIFDAPLDGAVGVRVTTSDEQAAVGSAPAYVIFEPAPEPEPELEPTPEVEGVYEVLDGGPLPFRVETPVEASVEEQKTPVVYRDDNLKVVVSANPWCWALTHYWAWGSSVGYTEATVGRRLPLCPAW